MTLLLEGSAESLAGVETEERGASKPRWSLARRVAFRFGVAYLLFATFPGPLDVLDPVDLQRHWFALWTRPVTWLVAHVLGGPPVQVRLGSQRDDLAGWLFTACLLALAAIVAAIWSLLDRRSDAYPRLADLAQSYLRFFLGAIVFHYGFIKVICGQFPHPDLASMMTPLGQMPPMGLLWNAMGAAPLYQAFGGAIEVLGAVLLFFRRTTLLGALIVLAAMANVLALNLAYDVFVKQFTLHLIVFALVIIGLHRARLVAFFLRERAVAPAPPERLRFASPLDRAWRVAGLALAAWILVSGVRETRALAARNTEAMPAWCGLFEVTSFSLDGREVPPLFGDHQRWRRVVLFPGALVAELGDDQRELWLGPRDEDKHTFSIQLDTRATFSGPIPGEPSILRYEERDGEVLALDGTLGGRSFTATLHRLHPTFRVERPTGHWVDDGTFQR